MQEEEEEVCEGGVFIGGVIGRKVCGCVLKATRRLLHSLPVVNTHRTVQINKIELGKFKLSISCVCD